MKLIHDLIEKGFKPFRNGVSGYEPCSNPSWFSSVEPGKTDVRLKLDDKEVVIGLHEMGYPPTLIHPMLGCGNVDIEKAIRGLSVDDIIRMA